VLERKGCPAFVTLQCELGPLPPPPLNTSTEVDLRMASGVADDEEPTPAACEVVAAAAALSRKEDSFCASHLPEDATLPPLPEVPSWWLPAVGVAATPLN